MGLHIIALAKQVMDPETPTSGYRVDRELRQVVPTAQIPPVINGFDENSLEAALRIKDAGEEVKVTVLSAGPSFTMDVMKKALSMGNDDLVLVQDDAMTNISDSLVTATVLAAAIRKIGDFDLILAGRQASDWDNAQVPLILAEILDLPCIPLTRKVEVKDGQVQCEHILENGYSIISSALPAVVTVSNELGEPRYPNIRNIMAAARKTPTTWTLTDIGLSEGDLAPKLNMVDLFIPEKQSQCEIIEGEDEADAGRKLALKLREAKLV
ncbi:MAG: hypothetical protein BZY82_05365 [SAR202 cluster bacterium Io17-Chloro-G3]|nr:MAG: hypothetical protein BZY82_05365 [SAR202 cluster bacterium Io17-Chloro-G3]